MQTTNTPHVHAELIKAWADGKRIQYLNDKGEWYFIAFPRWHPDKQYRIHPRSIEVVLYCFAKYDAQTKQANISTALSAHSRADNLQLTFCASTGKLKLAKAIIPSS